MKHKKTFTPRNLIGPKVRELRRLARPKISQEDLCGRMAVYGVVLTRVQIAKIETRRRPISDAEVAALAKALKVPMTELYQPVVRETTPKKRP